MKGKYVNRSELVSAIAEKSDVAKSDVDKVLSGFHDVVAKALKDREKVTIPGFANFEAKARAARTGRNPRTGEAIQIPASHVVKISAGSKLKDAANNK